MTDQKLPMHWIYAVILASGATAGWLALGHAPLHAHQTSVRQSSSGASLAPPEAERPFLDENDAAMSRMMADMAAKPTGDIDYDFVAMMIPHHQGAIDMALALLRHGHNQQLRRLAQEIIVTQQQEIAAMRLAIAQSSTGQPAAAQPATN